MSAAVVVAGTGGGRRDRVMNGHNDQKRSNKHYMEKRWADPKGLFRDIVRGWVAEIRAKGASPILASPIRRGTFDKAGKCLVDTTHASDGVCLGSYREAMEELSRELKCDYVDMNTLTRDLMERVGKAETEKFFVISTGILKDKDLTEAERKDISDDFQDIIEMAEILEEDD